jgi:DNA-binding PadR family transcriptional regulator
MTNAELAVLGLVGERPRHGYEIEQVIHEREMREWTEIGFSSIYYVLKKLELQGLIEGHLVAAGQGPARRVFHQTCRGAHALRVGLLDALAVPHRCYPPLRLGLANLPAIPCTEALAALRQRRDALIDRLQYVQERWGGQRPLPYFVDAMFDHSTTMITAEVTWIDGFVQQLMSHMEEEDGQDGLQEEDETSVSTFAEGVCGG